MPRVGRRPWAAGTTLVGASLLAVAWLVTSPRTAQAEEIFAPSLGNQALIGAGVRSRWGFQVYAIGLYADRAGLRGVAAGNADAIVRGNFDKTVDIRMMRTVGADKMREAFEDSLSHLKGLPALDQFLSYFNVGQLPKGTRVLLQMRAGVVHTSIGGRPMPPIASPQLAAGLLAVWMGPSPSPAI